MDRGAWEAPVHGVEKELDMTRDKQQQQHRHTTFYYTLLCYTSQILCFLLIESSWQPCIKKIYWHHFSNSIYSFDVTFLVTLTIVQIFHY